MKRLIILIFSVFLLAPGAFAQRNVDFGIMGGVSSYFGEINPVRPFYSPSPTFGGFFRFNINKRYAAKFSVSRVQITADTRDFPDRTYVDLNNQPVAVEANNAFTDLALQTEFNFLPYITGDVKSLSSTYISGGIGYMFFGEAKSFTIPFGVGGKVNLGDRLSAGIELSFRKTFTDNLDNYENTHGNTAFNNNDWYSILGLFISYKFVKFAADCPVYK